jgi:hypothetical protein
MELYQKNIDELQEKEKTDVKQLGKNILKLEEDEKTLIKDMESLKVTITKEGTAIDIAREALIKASNYDP